MKTVIRMLLSLFIILYLGAVNAKEALTVLTAYPEDVVSHFETAFEQANPDIDVVILWRMPHDALPYLRKPKQGDVDVYWSAALNNFMTLKQEHAWQKLAINRDGLPNKLGVLSLTDADDYFATTETAGYGFAINPDYLKKHNLPVPKTWQDLADSRYQGHLALPIPSRVGFAPMMIDSVLQQYGWEKGWQLLTDIAVNAKLVESGATFVSDILGKGERGIAPTIDFFTQSAIANGAALKFIYPEPTAYSSAQIAITTSTPRVDSARRFVNFVLSEKGQKLLFHPDIRKLPIRPAVYKDKPADYFDPFQAAGANPVIYDPDNASSRLALNNAMFDVLITERQQRLQTLLQKLTALLKVSNEAELATIRSLLTQPPIDEKTAQDVAVQLTFTKRGKDENAKSQALALEKTWQQQLDQRYAQVDTLLQQMGR